MNSWKKSFFTIAIGQMVSLIGSSAVQFALIWWVATQTESPLMLGLSGLVAFIPTVILSPIAGIAADRYNRKIICIAADLFIGVVAAVFALTMWLWEPPVWIVLVILFMRGIGNTFHQPSIQAIIPQLVPPDYLVKANSWNQIMSSGSFMLGPVIGAALYAAMPLPFVLLTDLLGALIASGLLAVVSIPRLERGGQERRNVKSELMEGLGVYRADRRLLLVVVAETVCMVFFFPLSSFYPLMTSSYFSASAWHASAVEFAFAAGMMIASFLLGSVIRVNRKIVVAYIGLLGTAAASFVGGILPPTMFGWVIFMIACGLMGGFMNVFNIPIVAYMQETIAPEKMGRAFSLLSLSGSVAMPVGLLIGSPIAEKVGVHTWFAITGIATALIAIAALLVDRRLQKGSARGGA